MARAKRKADEIVDLAATLRERYRERDARLDIALDYFHHSGLLRQTEETMYRVRIPDMMITADLIADLIAAQEVRVVVPPMGESVDAKRKADQLERFLAAWLNTIQREEDLSLVHELAYDAIRYGALLGRIVYRRPEANYGDGFPITIQLRDWRHAYPVFCDNRLDEIVECYPTFAGDAMRSLGVHLDMADNDEILVYEYWSHSHSAIWIETTTGLVHSVPSQPVWVRKPSPHGYGCLPYFLRFVRPRSRNRVAPEYMAPSLLQSWLPSIQILNLLESARLTAHLGYVSGAWAVKTANPNFELDLTAGAVNFLRPEESIEPIVRAPVSADLAQAAAEWQARFQRSSVPAALYGEITGVTAGYAISLLSDSGRRILIPLIKAIQATIAEACQKMLLVADELMRPVYGEVSLLALSGNGVVSRLVMPSVRQAHVEVQLGDPLPRDKERSVNMAVALRTPNRDGMPLLSDETIRDQILGVTDNEQELRRVLRERMMATMAGVVLADVVQEIVGEEASEGIPPEAVSPETVPPEAVSPEAVPPEAVPPEAAEPIMAPPFAGPQSPTIPTTNDMLAREYLALLQQTGQLP